MCLAKLTAHSNANDLHFLSVPWRKHEMLSLEKACSWQLERSKKHWRLGTQRRFNSTANSWSTKDLSLFFAEMDNKLLIKRRKDLFCNCPYVGFVTIFWPFFVSLFDFKLQCFLLCNVCVFVFKVYTGDMYAWRNLFNLTSSTKTCKPNRRREMPAVRIYPIHATDGTSKEHELHENSGGDEKIFFHLHREFKEVVGTCVQPHLSSRCLV